jgi:hypothetical protein
MDHAALIGRLEAFGKGLPTVVAGFAAADLRWKPLSGNWSILEVLCHLADEEVEDFRARLAFVLEQREGGWPSIDPERWAMERQYNEQDAGAVVARFVHERERSVAWLRGLGMKTDWSLGYDHPRFGKIPGGVLLASWAAHDALHLRQIAKRMHEMAARDGGEYGTIYAGEWRA